MTFFTGIAIASTAGVSLLMAQPGLHAGDPGIVESVGEMQGAAAGPAGFAAAFELAHGNGKEVLVQLDDGRTAIVVRNEATAPRPGERVRVLALRHGARLEYTE